MVCLRALSRCGGPATLTFIFLLAAALANAKAESFNLDSAGARFGVSANSSSKNFYQSEAFLDLKLPWSWDLGRSWRVRTGLDASLGWLGNQYEDGAIGVVAPFLTLGREGFPVHLDAGVGPTGISRTEYVSKDFGVQIQFTSFAGLYWDFARHFRLGYRYQHMSNASIGRSNPGLNLHMVGLSYLF
jgi:Lipid A 3-O-deacylase (PagL)